MLEDRVYFVPEARKNKTFEQFKEENKDFNTGTGLV